MEMKKKKICTHKRQQDNLCKEKIFQAGQRLTPRHIEWEKKMHAKKNNKQ